MCVKSELAVAATNEKETAVKYVLGGDVTENLRVHFTFKLKKKKIKEREKSDFV